MRGQSIFALAPLALAVVAAAQIPGPAPRLDAWQVIGPGGGGTMIEPTVSPHDPGLVVEHCDMTGSYITQDGGQSWRMFNLRMGVETFAFDPNNPKRIYAGNTALWRSDDTGRSWRMIFPNPAKKTVEHRIGDHGDYSLTSNDENYVTGLTIRQIVVDPGNSNIVHIAFSDPHNGGTTTLVSKDSGNSFHFERDLLGEQSCCWLILAASGWKLGRGASTVAGRIMPSRSRGLTRRLFMPAPEWLEAGQLFLQQPARENLFVSEDAGKTWQSRTPALGQKSGEFGAVSTAGRDGRVAYVGFRGLILGDRGEDVYNGIAKTVDAGKSWSIVLRESTRAASNIDGSWIDQRSAGIEWGGDKSIIFDAPYSIGVAPNNPDICYATDLFEPTVRWMEERPGRRSTLGAPRRTVGRPGGSTSPQTMECSSIPSIPGIFSSITPTLELFTATMAASPGSPRPTGFRRAGGTQPIGWHSIPR